jgi:hypothetical protein
LSNKPSDSPAHPYEPESYPILKAWPEFWWMPEAEKAALMEALARKLGGQGYLPKREKDQGQER